MGFKARKKVILQARPVLPQQWPKNAWGNYKWVTVRAKGRSSEGWALGKDRDEAMPKHNVPYVKNDFEEACGTLSFEFREVEE
jgi:hypothetical protein